MSRSTDAQGFLDQVAKLARPSSQPVFIVIEGMSGAGKSTLAHLIHERFGGHLLQMDDFFLQPHQRTPERLAEPGGNVDYERFSQEVLKPLINREQIYYRAFNCKTQSFNEAVVLEPAPLWIVEGCYSLHPRIVLPGNLTLFMEIDPGVQIQTIEKRNGPDLALRFAREWIPMENTYFETFGIRNKCQWIIKRA